VCKDNEWKNENKGVLPKIQQQNGFLSLCMHLTVGIGTQEVYETSKNSPSKQQTQPKILKI
jgi:hypothetical protein